MYWTDIMKKFKNTEKTSHYWFLWLLLLDWNNYSNNNNYYNLNPFFSLAFSLSLSHFKVSLLWYLSLSLSLLMTILLCFQVPFLIKNYIIYTKYSILYIFLCYNLNTQGKAHGWISFLNCIVIIWGVLRLMPRKKRQTTGQKWFLMAVLIDRKYTSFFHIDKLYCDTKSRVSEYPKI